MREKFSNLIVVSHDSTELMMNISLKVKPGCKREEIINKDDEIIFTLRSQPIEGKANIELVKKIKKILATSNIELIKGSKSKLKTLQVTFVFDDIHNEKYYIEKIIKGLKC